MKKKAVVPSPEKTVIAGIETTSNGRLERFLTAAFTKGYVLVCPPVYAGTEISPIGSLVGESPRPQFLVVLQKLPSTPTS